MKLKTEANTERETETTTESGKQANTEGEEEANIESEAKANTEGEMETNTEYEVEVNTECEVKNVDSAKTVGTLTKEKCREQPSTERIEEAPQKSHSLVKAIWQHHSGDLQECTKT